MATAMSENGERSPAGKAMNEAIELAIAGKSPYPESAAFLDAGTPYTEREMAQAFGEGFAVVLVSPDGSTRVVRPDTAAS
jgi:hypothetical protein